MGWFSKKNQDATVKVGSVAGAILGSLIGFSVGGIGGALLLVILGGVIGFCVSVPLASIFDEDAVSEFFGFAVLIGIPILFLIAVSMLWNVGN